MSSLRHTAGGIMTDFHIYRLVSGTKLKCEVWNRSLVIMSGAFYYCKLFCMKKKETMFMFLFHYIRFWGKYRLNYEMRTIIFTYIFVDYHKISEKRKKTLRCPSFIVRCFFPPFQLAKISTDCQDLTETTLHSHHFRVHSKSPAQMTRRQ